MKKLIIIIMFLIMPFTASAGELKYIEMCDSIINISNINYLSKHLNSHFINIIFNGEKVTLGCDSKTERDKVHDLLKFMLLNKNVSWYYRITNKTFQMYRWWLFRTTNYDNTTSTIDFVATNMIEEKIQYDRMMVQSKIIDYTYNSTTKKYRLTVFNGFSSDIELFEGIFTDSTFVVENTFVSYSDSIKGEIFSKSDKSI